MNSRIAVKYQRVPIHGLPPEVDGLSIAHISDLHFRAWDAVYAYAQQLLIDLRYDLLVVTGDFSDQPHQWREAAEWCHRFFEPVKPPLGTYAVLGNHDDRRLGQVTDLPMTWLNNTSTRLQYDKGHFYIAGVQQDVTGGGRIEDALAETKEEHPVILLAHYPSTAYDVPAGRVQLVLAGHTHGGQIRLPLLGCLWTNDRLPCGMARGLHLVGKTWLHVNPGIGVCNPFQVRILCPPEITILKLARVAGNVRPDAAEEQYSDAPVYVSDSPRCRGEPQEAQSGAAYSARQT